MPDAPHPATGWRSLWVPVPEPGSSRVAKLTFVRDLCARWIIVMVIAAVLLATTGIGWAIGLGIAVVALSIVNVAIVDARLRRARAHEPDGP